MRNFTRIILMVGCVLILVISWIIVLGAKSNSEKQDELITRASDYVNDGVYILAAPLLEEAITYETERTSEAEESLKEVYLNLMEQSEDKSSFRKQYIGLLEKQMNSSLASVTVYLEAANFYLGDSKYVDAYNVMKNGIEKTSSDELISLYEDTRYQYSMGYDIFDDVTEIYGNTISVNVDGLWGIASYTGKLLIPCVYEKVSTYSEDRAIVKKDGSIYAVDSSNNRLSLLKEEVFDFGNYSNERITLLTNEGWQRASGDFAMGSAVFEEIGTYANGYVAAKLNGKWGLVDISTEWLVPAENDEVLMDDIGRSYAQEAVFVKNGGNVHLYANGMQVGEPYDDAKPFNNEGYAAVKKNGKWGFIDSSGNLKIDYKFEEALSFGQHLAAVKTGEFWGYISLTGKIVIEPVFMQAKSFVSGYAPVLTERGWQFISLLEYQKGATL